MFVKMALENFANFTGKQLCWSLYFNKVTRLKRDSKKLQHICFPVKFAKTPPVAASVL